MSFWKKLFGNTKTEESKNPKNYKKKYLTIKKAHESLKDECSLVVQSVTDIMNERDIIRFLIFCVSVQCGGRLEISEETVKIATDMYKTHDIDIREENKMVIVETKRKPQ